MGNETVRTFELPHPAQRDEKTVLRALSLGKVEDLLPASREGYRGFHRTVALFDNMRVRRATQNGSVERKPRLLICGGFVRDTLMGKFPKDIDFATDATYEEIRASAETELSDLVAEGRVKLLETGTPGKSYRVLRVVFEECNGQPREAYEVATFRVDSADSDGRRPDATEVTTYAGVDAQRRDLTINALYYNVATGHVLDYVGGLADIESRVLRFVGDPGQRIREDNLRMFRYIRFLLRTGFSPDEGAVAAIREYAPRAKGLSGERVRDELVHMLHLSPGGAVRALERVCLLREVLPEVAALRDCPQGPPYHLEGDVLEHTAMVCDALARDAQTVGAHPSDELLLAALLHDLAKPDTREERTVSGPHSETTQKVSFRGHDVLGARLLADRRGGSIPHRLHLPNITTKRVAWLIENHLRVFDLPHMKDWKAVQLASHEGFDELLALARADIRSSVRSDPAAQAGVEGEVGALMARAEGVQALRAAWEAYLADLDTRYPDMRGFNGHFLKEQYAIKDGPHLARIKEHIHHTLFRLRDLRPRDREQVLRVIQSVVREVCGGGARPQSRVSRSV